MGKKDKSKENLPPSLFDNLDLFAAASDAQGEAEKPERKSAKSAKAAPPPPPSPASKGLTGAGPMQQLYDFNFRQYSAYVICSRAIPAVEDGLARAAAHHARALRAGRR